MFPRCVTSAQEELFLTNSRSPLNAHYSPVPSNFQFQQLDITADPLPWEPASFDVVHIRLVLIHVRSRTALPPDPAAQST